MKKVIKINRNDGKLISSHFGVASEMSEQQYFRPFVDLYKESLEHIKLEKAKEKGT